MRTVAIISRKGGAGKTNIAVHLAACAEGKGMRAGIVDLDPQATSTKWGARRAENASCAGADVVSAQAFSLPKLLAEARSAGARLMLLDTAPHADAMAVDAARAADFVLIPCRPAIADIEAIPASADIARLAGKPFAVVLNAAVAQGTRDEARSELERLGLVVAPVEVGHRVAFGDAMIPGQGVTEYRSGSAAAQEIEKLFDWMLRHFGNDAASGRPVAARTRRRVAA